MTHYEVLYLVSANYTEDELRPIRQNVLDLIKKAGGQITFEESFGRKKMAYPIKHNHQGYYLIAEFDIDTQNVKELDRQLRLTNEVLRHIIVKKELGAPSVLKLDDETPGRRDDELMFGKVEKKEPRPHAVPENVAETTPAAAPVASVESTPAAEPKAEDKTDKKKVSLEELDQKLDEILEGDIL